MFLPKNLRPPTYKSFLWQSLQMGARRFLPVVEPSFFVVGAQKCGTTSLANFLAQHPLVKAPHFKELRFFNLDYHYEKGPAYYRSLFPARYGKESGRYQSFDATPEYLYHPQVACRINSAYPDAKIVILVRDPVARAYSGWNMFCDYRRRGKTHSLFRHPITPEQCAIRDLFFNGQLPSFSEIIELEMGMIENGDPCYEPSVIRRGMYADQIERYLREFGANNVHVESLKHFRTKPHLTLHRLCDFLGLGYDESQGGLPVAHARQYGERIRPQDHDRLTRFYEPHNQRLIRLLGRELDW